MLTPQEVEQAWSQYDPFSEHEMGNEFCPYCFTTTRMCHKCGGDMHNQLIDVPDNDGTSRMMIEYLCEDCIHYYTEEVERLR